MYNRADINFKVINHSEAKIYNKRIKEPGNINIRRHRSELKIMF